MSQAQRHPLTDLPRDGTLRIADGRAHVVAVFEGQVWLTQDGDARDVFLEAGESFNFESSGVTLVQAMRDARLLVSGPAALDGPRRRADPLPACARYARRRSGRADRARCGSRRIGVRARGASCAQRSARAVAAAAAHVERPLAGSLAAALGIRFI
jgi:hypothetical protein